MGTGQLAAALLRHRFYRSARGASWDTGRQYAIVKIELYQCVVPTTERRARAILKNRSAPI